MEPEAEPADGREASLLNRRQYLLATGVVAAGGVLPGSATAAATTDVAVDALAPTVNHTWDAVEVPTSFSDPVVVAPALSYRGTNPASPRLRDVSAESFEVRAEEWAYLDGAHLAETIGCVVGDEGTYAPADGPRFEVHRTSCDDTWTVVPFSSFQSTPVVFTSAQTRNAPQPVVTRNRSVASSGVEVRLQTEEAGAAPSEERVGVLAVEPGSGTVDGRAMEAGTAIGVGSAWHTISFSGTYEEPVFLADLQSFRGANTATVRFRNLTGASVEVKVEEERSEDDEVAHLGESVGYLVFDGTGSDDLGYGIGGFGEAGFGA